MKDRISIAAEMAGQWWADRLDPQYADKRDAFAAAITVRVEQELRGEFHWTWYGGTERTPGDLTTPTWIRLHCDYDPKGLLLDAVRETVSPECRGFGSSADDLLPMKTDLTIRTDTWVMEPKEGYANHTQGIPIPLPG
jgi:hypothetical protein